MNHEDIAPLRKGSIIRLSTTASDTVSKGTVVAVDLQGLSVRFDDMFDVVQFVPFSQIRFFALDAR